MLVKKKNTETSDVKTLSVQDAIADISHPETSRRREAAVALYGQAEALEVLAQRLDDEPSNSVREAIVAALIGIGSVETVDYFIGQLSSDEADRRNEAVYALQQMPEQSSEKIRTLLADPEADLRIMAVDVIRLLTISKASVWLRDLLEHEDHPNVAGVAIDRLCEIGSIEDVPTLERVKDRFSNDPYLQFAADHAIKRIISLDAEEPI